MKKEMSALRKKTPSWLRSVASVFLDIVYPEGALCQGCGRITDGQCLCPACRDELRHAGMMYAWDQRILNGVPAWSLRGHTGLARHLILRLKYNADACIAQEMADVLLPLPPGLSFSPDTVVTWVPMPKRRKQERCVDHGQLLAEASARKLRLLCRPLLLRRKDHAHTQEGLTREQRSKNLRHAFIPLQQIGFPVLLVDDVLTTGTTALRCISALREAGASRITVLTFTHSIR